MHLVVNVEGWKWGWALSKASDEGVPGEDARLEDLVEDVEGMGHGA